MRASFDEVLTYPSWRPVDSPMDWKLVTMKAARLVTVVKFVAILPIGLWLTGDFASMRRLPHLV